MVFSRNLILVLIIAVGSLSAALADTGIPFVGVITHTIYEDASLLVLPDGSGPPLTEARDFLTQPVDATIVVNLIDYNGAPIVNFPWEDIWLEPETDTARSCFFSGHNGFTADQNTDSDGMTHFINPLAGGGWTEGPIWVYLNGSPAMDPDGWVHPPVPLQFNSPDINADGVVNLTDVAFFAGDYFGAYHFRSDFWWDGVLNLADVVKISEGFGTSCE